MLDRWKGEAKCDVRDAGEAGKGRQSRARLSIRGLPVLAVQVVGVNECRVGLSLLSLGHTSADRLTVSVSHRGCLQPLTQDTKMNISDAMHWGCTTMHSRALSFLMSSLEYLGHHHFCTH